MSKTITVTKIERTASMFDFGDEKSDYTLHYDGGEAVIQDSYASDVQQALADECERLLGDADAVEPDNVVIDVAGTAEIDDDTIKAVREADR